MGTLRFLLALAVIIEHSTGIFGLRMVGGSTAVQTFYVISGFYMALILEKKYSGTGSYKLFITNRFLRIFPLYWCVLGLTVFISLLFWAFRNDPFLLGAYADYGGKLGIIPLFIFIASNIFIFGQDILMFAKLSDSFQFLLPTENFRLTSPQLYTFLLVPQAWTVSVELLFYLIAPFLTKLKSSFIALLILCSIGLRIYIYSKGLISDPWTYRLFPTELVFFLVGILGFRYRNVLKKYTSVHVFDPLVWGICMYVTLFYHRLPVINETRQIIYFPLIILSLPFLFSFTNKFKIDRLLGELSFPLYIVHILVLSILNKFFSTNADFMENKIGLACAILSTFISVILVRCIATPLEHHRQSRVRKSKGQAAFVKQ